MSTGVIKLVGLLVLFNVNNDPNVHTDPSMVAVGNAGHSAYIAYDDREAKPTSKKGFKQVKNTHYWYLPLNGVTVEIVDDPAPGTPRVDMASYKDVARAYDYWPGLTHDVWHADYVQKRNPAGPKPKKAKVAARMKFGNGRFSAAWPTKCDYIFKDGSGQVTAAPKRYNREVIYDFPLNGPTLDVKLSDLSSGKKVRSVGFSALSAGNDVQIWVGNSANEDDMLASFEHVDPQYLVAGTHFKHLHRVFHDMDEGPIPEPDPACMCPPGQVCLHDYDSGYCGPTSGDGP